MVEKHLAGGGLAEAAHADDRAVQPHVLAPPVHGRGLGGQAGLHLARQLYPDIPAVYVDTGCEYPENVAFAGTVPNVVMLRYNMSFGQVVRDFGIPLISKEVSKRIYYARHGSHWAIMQLNGFNKDGTYSKFNQRYKKWRFLLDAPFPIAERCCSELKTKPLTRYQRESGRVPITGVMACESARRRSAFLKTGCNVYRERKPA